jgi:hypothetical protein
MKQGRMMATSAVAVAIAMAVAAGLALDARSPGPAYAARSAVSSKPAATKPSPRKSANTLRQFTGYVTALDKSSITVEKHGKKPRTMTFVKHDEMRTTGEIEKDARVTVYYREEGGRAVAHRIVVKPEDEGTVSER